MKTLLLKAKRASITRTAADVQDALKDVQALMVKADCFKAVTGAIPEGILSAVDSALSVLIPIASVLGDAELTALLASLKVWIHKKQAEAEMEQEQSRQMQNLGWSDFWTI